MGCGKYVVAKSPPPPDCRSAKKVVLVLLSRPTPVEIVQMTINFKTGSLLQISFCTL